MATYDENGNLVEEQQEQTTTPRQQTVTEEYTETVKPSEKERDPQAYYSFQQQWKDNNPIESDEDYEKRRRRTKNAAIIGAIGEGLSSLANLYYTTKYSPSAEPTKLSEGMRKRYDDMEAERQKNRESWAKGYQQAKQLDEQKAEKDRNWRRQLQRDLADDKNKEQTLAMKGAELKLKQDKEAREAAREPDLLRANKAKADEAETKARNAQKIADATVAKLRAQTAAAGRSNRGGSGSGKEPKIAYDGKGGYTIYVDKDNYESAIYSACEQAGIPIHGEKQRKYNDLTGQMEEIETYIPINVLNGELKKKGLEVVKAGNQNTVKQPAQAKKPTNNQKVASKTEDATEGQGEWYK